MDVMRASAQAVHSGQCTATSSKCLVFFHDLTFGFDEEIFHLSADCRFVRLIAEIASDLAINVLVPRFFEV